MKKSIVMTLVLALIISLSSMVFAAVELVPVTASVTSSAEAGVAKTGDIVTVTVSLLKDGVAQNIDMADLNITYNASVLKYVEKSAGAKYETVSNGTVSAQYMGVGKTSLTFQFEVIGEKGTESPVTFVPVQLTSTGVEYKVESASTTIKVGPVEEEPGIDEPTNPGTTEPANPGEEIPKDSGSKKDEVEQTGKPSKLPQTGINYVVVGGVVVALIAVAAVAKKIND